MIQFEDTVDDKSGALSSSFFLSMADLGIEKRMENHIMHARRAISPETVKIQFNSSKAYKGFTYISAKKMVSIP